MTVTEVPRDGAVAEATETEPTSPVGLAALVGTGDPRSIGKLYVGTSLAFLLGVVVAGVLVAVDQAGASASDLLTGNTDILGGDFAQTATFHQIGGLFLVLLPLLIGIAHAVVPLQVGASTVAFPRASAASYWVYLVSGGLLVAAYIADGGPFGGDDEAVGLFVAAFVALLVALCTAAISITATVLALRAPGMTLRKVPLFSWSMMVAGTIWVLTLPVLAALLVLYYVDTTYAGYVLFERVPLFAEDGETIVGSLDSVHLFDQIRWVFWQPVLYAFAIPALGIIGDVVPVFAQRRLFKHPTALVLIGLFGVASFGSWIVPTTLPTGTGERMVADELVWFQDNQLWSTLSVVALVSLLGLLGLWTVTLLAGRLRLTGALGLSLVAGLLLTLGVALGIGTAVPESDLFGTTWMSGQAYAVLVATFVAALAGLVFWAPKLYGRTLPDAVAKILAPLALVGGALVAGSYAIAGVLHQPWPLETFVDHGNEVTEEDAVEALGGVAAAGIGVLLLAGLMVIVALLFLSRGARQAEDDPWNGHTLEWATSSPPPVGNFAELPEITSEAPVYDRRHGATTEEVTA